MNLQAVCSERDETRSFHEIERDILLSYDDNEHPKLWRLLNELKDSAWESGAEEAMAWHEAFTQYPYSK